MKGWDSKRMIGEVKKEFEVFKQRPIHPLQDPHQSVIDDDARTAVSQTAPRAVHPLPDGAGEHDHHDQRVG